MKQKLLANIKTDTSGRWVDIGEVEKIVDAVIAEAIHAVAHTGTQCAFTTHDLGMVQCTIERSVKTLKDYFGVK